MSVALRNARMGSSRYPTSAGDPGIFSAIGGALKAVGKVALATVTGGPVAGATSAIKTVGGLALGGGGSSPAIRPPSAFAPQTPPGTSVTTTSLSGTNRIGPGFVVQYSTTPGVAATEQGTVGGGCPKGMHPNKSGYYRTVPGPSGGKQVVYIPPNHICVKNRRRNPLNPRALDRSMSRLESAGKAIKRLGFRAPTVKHVAQKGKAKKRKR